jgi:competence protein ComEA
MPQEEKMIDSKRLQRIAVCFSVCLVIGVIGAMASPVLAAGSAGTDGSSGKQVVIDLNKATEMELTKVRGIGPALAKRIVDFRKEHGPFGKVDDILKVRGIGEKSLAKLKPHLKVTKKGA